MQSGWAKFRRQEGFMGRMVFSCFSAAWGCLVVCFFPVFDIGLCPKGDQDAQRSSFLFTGNPLHFPSASPWASEGKNIPLAKCLAARLLFFFCLLYSRIFPSDCCFGEFASSNLPLSFGLLPSLSRQLLLWSKKECEELKSIQSLPVQAHLTSRNHSPLQASALLSLTRLILMMLNL